MLAFYNERKYLLISIIVIIIDGLLTYYIPSYFNHLNYFYPMLTITLIPFIYMANKNNYYLIIIASGIIYDLLYSKVFLYNVIMMLILIKIDIKITKYLKKNILLFILLAIINIFIYDTISFLLIVLSNYSQVMVVDLIYKICHSMILNILSVFVFWFMFKKDIHIA